MTLLDRLKAASGPDRELDAEIAVKYGGYFEGRGRDGWFAHKDDPDIFSGYCPNYSGSIDAALTLVPKGWHMSCHTGKYATEHCVTLQSFIGECGEFGEPIGEVPIGAVSPSKPLPIAICIAAIQAKGHDDE